MDIPLNAEVQCADGECGKSVAIIANRADNSVIYVVVRTTKGEEVRVPVNIITESEPGKIYLRLTQKELNEQKPLTWTNLTPDYDVDRGLVASPEIAQRAAGASATIDGQSSSRSPELGEGGGLDAQEVERLRVQEVSLHLDTKVFATDGPVGQLDELLIDPKTNTITHVILRKGVLWGQRDVTIDASALDALLGDEVYLNLDKDSIDKLPGVKPRT